MNFKSDISGTKIWEPLKSVFDNNRNNEKKRIFLLTDGEIDNKDEVIDLITENCTKENDWKVFTIGIVKRRKGAEGTIDLCDDCAKAGHGLSTIYIEKEMK